jgi:hypothetical protein
MTEKEILGLLGMSEVRYPYTDKDFVNLLVSNELLSSASTDHLRLSVLAQAEMAYIYPSEYGLSYGEHHISLFGWEFGERTAIVLREFDLICKKGLPVLPAFQKILGFVIEMIINERTPLGDPSLKSIKNKELQKTALYMACRFIEYLGDTHETACLKASEIVLTEEPGTVGVSPDRLKKLLQSESDVRKIVSQQKKKDLENGNFDFVCESLANKSAFRG